MSDWEVPRLQESDMDGINLGEEYANSAGLPLLHRAILRAVIRRAYHAERKLAALEKRFSESPILDVETYAFDGDAWGLSGWLDRQPDQTIKRVRLIGVDDDDDEEQCPSCGATWPRRTR